MFRQQMFCPIDYSFSWSGDWYTFDHKAGHEAALKARNKRAKELRAQGYRVRQKVNRYEEV